MKVFYLNTNIVRTHERNAGRGVPLLVVAEHAIGTTADRVAFITIAQVVASPAFNYRQTALDPSLAPASDSPYRHGIAPQAGKGSFLRLHQCPTDSMGKQLRIRRYSLRRRTLFFGFACRLKRGQVRQYPRPRFLHLLGSRCGGKSVDRHALILFLRDVQDSAFPRLELCLRQSKLSPWRAENADYPKGTTARSITAVYFAVFSMKPGVYR